MANEKDKVKPADLKPSTVSPVIPAPIPVEPEHKAKKGKKSAEKTFNPNLVGVKSLTKPVKPIFPHTAKINKYGFLFFSDKVREALKIQKGKDYSVTMNYEGGILTIKV